ncbi:MAG: tyrosine-type recombinase/integrase [Proteobacteria bacterium]|nr:tyrosine-type recombinase/integrase [Pseudomonadota bacterium]
MLMEKVDDYLALRRAAGYALEVPEYHLRNFARFAAKRKETLICASMVIEWASQAPSLNQREHRLQVVLRFARHLQAEDPRHEVPPKGIFRRRRTRPTPYIWTPQEVTLLLQAAARLEPQDSLRPHMYSTLFALLHVTGLRISEALALEFDDFDSDTLLVRETKFKKSRRIPLHHTAVAGLQRYIEHRRRVTTEHKLLFISVRGRRLDRSSVGWVFRRLLKTVGIKPGQQGRRPRIHDLRHAFATRALETCPEGRDNIGRHMLALSTYLGHTHISDTYWYLEATPTLMRDIADSCEASIQGGVR